MVSKHKPFSEAEIDVRVQLWMLNKQVGRPTLKTGKKDTVGLTGRPYGKVEIDKKRLPHCQMSVKRHQPVLKGINSSSIDQKLKTVQGIKEA